MCQSESNKYESPVLEIIEVNVERGFSSTGNLEDPEDGGPIN